MINFTSLEFIFRFLLVFLPVYFLVPKKAKNWVMFIGSLIFYAFGEPIPVLLLVALTVLNYLFGSRCFNFPLNYSDSYAQKMLKRKTLTAIVIDISVLVVFKAVSIFVDNSLFPLGLSFYIFKMISYQMDIMKRNIPVKPTFVQTAAYFTLFAQVTQGPIMRYEDGEFFNEKEPSWEKAEEGLKYFIIGFAMKTLLADRIGILWNDLSMYGYESISTPLAWLGTLAYSFELYFDFWGYSLMASGIMVAMGFDFVRNFDHPYASKTVSEFYRRWHMTLGSFFRDYVYFPLGGSRCDKNRMVLNLAIVWLLTGIWHGNGLNFLIWGAVLGIFIILEKLFFGKFMQNSKILGHLYLIVVIPLSWVIFAISDIKQLGIYFGRLFPFFGIGGSVVNSSDILQYLENYWWMFVIAIILCIPGVTKLYQKFSKSVVVTIGLFLLFWISIYFSASSAGNPFMYLNF